MAGPLWQPVARAATAAASPMASASTLPSLTLRTQPRNPRRRASRLAQRRKPTPWTRPVMTRRTAVTAIASGAFEDDLVDGEAVTGLGADHLDLAVALDA